MAKHSIATRNKTDEVIRLITEGMSTTEAVKTVGMGWNTLFEMLEDDPTRQKAYERARKIANEKRLEELEDIALDTTIDPQRARNIIEVRKWRASKINPKTYGDKLDLNITQSVDISLALEESMSRVINVTVRDVTPQSETLLTDQNIRDTQSDTRDPESN